MNHGIDGGEFMAMVDDTRPQVSKRGGRARRQRRNIIVESHFKGLGLVVIHGTARVRLMALEESGVVLDGRAVVGHADLLLACVIVDCGESAGVVVEMRAAVVAIGDVGEEELCGRAHELRKQMVVTDDLLVFLEGARRVLALGLEVLGLAEYATDYPPV